MKLDFRCLELTSTSAFTLKGKKNVLYMFSACAVCKWGLVLQNVKTIYSNECSDMFYIISWKMFDENDYHAQQNRNYLILNTTNLFFCFIIAFKLKCRFPFACITLCNTHMHTCSLLVGRRCSAQCVGGPGQVEERRINARPACRKKEVQRERKREMEER